jgi:hypothetical protein
MKKLLKIVFYFILTIIVLIIVLTVVAKLAENKITNIALKKISEEIQAPVVIEDVSFNLLREFPFATIELHNVLLGTPINEVKTDSLTIKSDTIISLSKIYVSVKSRPLLKGNIEILKIDINGANINYSVDTSGITNIDFLLSTNEDTLPSKPLNINLSDFTAKNIVCNYRDSSMQAVARIFIPKITADGKITGEKIIASVKGEISISNASFEKTNLNLMKKTDIQFDVDYNDNLLDITLLNITSDGAKLDLIGNLILGDEIESDVQFHGNNLIIEELIKYAPEKILQDVGLEKASGILNLEASVKGVYSKTEMPQVNLLVDFQNGIITTKDYPLLKNISFNGSASNGVLRNNQSTQAKFSKFHFETEQSKFDFNFSVLDLDHIKYDVKTELELNIEEFKSFIPDLLVNDIDGNIKASISTKGEVPDSITDDFIDFVMANSKAKIQFNNLNVESDSYVSFNDFSINFDYKPNSIKIDNLNIDVPLYNFELRNSSFDSDFTGSINNLSEMSIDLKSYYIKTKGAEISGFLKLKNLENPSYNTDTKIKINLGETIEMLPDSMFKSLSGSVVIDIRSKATLNFDSITDQAIDVAFTKSKIDVNIENFTTELLENSLYKVENLSGELRMNPDGIRINNLSGIAAGIDFGIDSTEIRNLYNSVIQNKPEELFVDTRMSLGDIDYAMLSLFMSSDSTAIEAQETTAASGKESANKVTEPTNYTILLRGVVSVRSFKYEKALLKDISTLFKVTDSVYIADQFKFSAFGGKMNNSIKYSIKPNNKNVVETHHIVDTMDIKKLLADFDDFEAFYEPSIRSENLSGLFSTDLFTRINMIDDSLVMKDIRVRGDFTLDDGGVYNFEPATNLSVVSNIHELDNIKFNTLTSKIFVSKNGIYLPETYISTETLGISAFGMQSFNGDSEYHLEVKLRDVLMGTSDRIKRKEKKNEDGKFKDERNMRKLFYANKKGKTDYGFSTSTQRSDMRSNVELKHKLLNFMFFPEMFKFETGVYQDKQ